MSVFVKKFRSIFFLFGLIIILLLAVLGLQIINYHKVSWGISVAGENISGLNYETAKNKIDASIQKIASQPIKFQFENRQFEALPGELGIAFDGDTTLKDAWQIGRSQNFFPRLNQQIRLLLFQKNLNINYKIDSSKFEDFLQENFSDLESPAKNASLKYQNATDDFVLIPAQEGKIFDRASIKNQLEKKISSFDQNPIILTEIVQKPVLTSDINDAAAIRAKQIINLAPYELKNGSSSWTIEKQILIDWLDFEPDQNSPQKMDATISQDAVKDFLAQLAPGINKEPVNATLTFKDNKVQMFVLSQNGQELNIDRSAQIISNEILSGEKEIDLAVEEKEPQITTETIDTLGLTDLLGVGTSTFAGSPKNRIYNIGIGAGKISGIVVDPGQEFSIVQTLGAIDASTGYLPELVIKSNKTIPEYGGGLCQVSTTLFRAAINAGLKITERYPHAFPVHYYNPQGFDATIYPPHPDLRFLNDTPNHILIQSKIKGNVISFEIYGTADGRQVKVTGPIILESNPDGSMKTVLYQEIWRDGAMERKDTFRSNYKSPALYPVVKNPLE